MLLKTITILFLVPWCDTFKTDKFVSNFFKYKQVKFVTVYFCTDGEYNVIDICKSLNTYNIRNSLISIDYFVNDFETFNSSLSIFYNRFGYVLDLSCNNSGKLLDMDANIDMWLTRYHRNNKWLLLTKANDNITTKYFENVELRLDSDVSLAELNNINIYLYEIYNSGANLGGSVKIIPSLIYDDVSGQFIRLTNMSFYDKRKNMSELTLKSGTVITKPSNLTPEVYLRNRLNPFDPLSKTSYALFIHIIGIHQFKNILVPTKIWFGSSPTGIEAGMGKQLWYRHTDVCASSGIIVAERVPAYDHLFATYTFGTCFIFRNPSAIGKIRNQFFDPFTANSWYICLLFCAFICVLLKSTFNVQSYFGKTTEAEASWSNSILNTLAAFCQQDIETDEQNITGRILILSLMMLSLMLYNYYTSSIVSDLINSKTQAFSTIGELVHSSLDLGMEDIAYTNRLFKMTVDPDLIYLRDKRILVPGKDKQYFPIEEGIQKLKGGGFGYHLEPASGYSFIAKTFDGAEICDLCEIYVFKKSLVYVLSQRRSQFREIFTISYRKMAQSGISKREILIWQARKPECLSSANVLQIELEQAAPAFFVLLFGIIFSCLILVYEIKSTGAKKIKPIKQKSIANKIYSLMLYYFHNATD